MAGVGRQVGWDGMGEVRREEGGMGGTRRRVERGKSEGQMEYERKREEKVVGRWRGGVAGGECEEERVEERKSRKTIWRIILSMEYTNGREKTKNIGDVPPDRAVSSSQRRHSRGVFDNQDDKRSDANGQNGMWFGPRIGRTLQDDEPAVLAASSGTSPWITAVRDEQERSRQLFISPYNSGRFFEYLDDD
nr:unnamed protein product [Callosobruchus analis]